MRRHSLVVLSAISIIFGGLGAQSQTCYWPNGAIHSGGQACFPNQTDVQSCCDKTHTCLSNGLCYDTVNNHILRGSCTDQSFEDTRCPRLCLDTNYEWGNLRQCNGQNTNWVCGQNVSNCRGDNTFTIVPGLVKDARPADQNNVIQAGNFTNAEASQTATPTTSGTDQTATPSTDATPQDTCSSSPTATTVGLATGLGVGLTLLLGLISTTVMLFKTRRENARLQAQQSEMTKYDAPPSQFGSTVGSTPHSAPAYATPSVYELSTARGPYELQYDQTSGHHSPR
ncbi:hypothetical protein F5B20DRAFT_517235 [Whalleya microplaca]|nr:hypothetical protein F5B20DRAFT_517235 [Whalleya microplaca]